MVDRRRTLAYAIVFGLLNFRTLVEIVQDRATLVTDDAAPSAQYNAKPNFHNGFRRAARVANAIRERGVLQPGL
jgi:hypothetical protein